MKRTTLMGALGLLALVGATSGNAWANTAAGVNITNTATLSYNGGVTVTSSVSVSVALKASNPNLTISGGSATYTGVNTPGIKQTVVITATANGPADYTVYADASAQTNNDPSGTATGSVNAQTPYNASAATNLLVSQLGATITVGTSGKNFVTVPATTGAVNGASINGITLGSHIVVGNENNSNTHEVVVTGIALQGDGNYRISWTGDIPDADVPGVGNVVGERRILNFYAYPGTVRAAGTDITVAVSATATNNGLSISTATPASNLWTTSAPTVEFLKYVRNADTNAAGDAASSTSFNGNSYYRSGVTAKPGEKLEYLIVARNTDAVNPLTGVAISDLLPVGSYATFVSNAYGANQDITYANTANAVSYLQTYGSGTHQALLSGQNLTVNVGDSATDAAGGSVPSNKTVKILYQLVIK